MRTFLISILLSGSMASGFCQTITYDIRDFGARADGQTNSTIAIQSAIDKANADGGGTVVIPAGKYSTGVITLRSGVQLFLEDNATLLGSTHRLDYGSGNASALIVASDQHDIAITGKGNIDGQGREVVKDLYRLLQEGRLQDPDWKVTRPKEKNRPKLIEFVNCSNVRIQGVTLKDAACWVQAYRKCSNLNIDSIQVMSLAYWNNDGVDIVNCSGVRITNSYFNTTDDGICLKSEGQPQGICENIYVSNCTIRSGANAFKMGTGSHDGYKNIIVRNLMVYDTYLSAIAIECVDGCILENVDVQNISAKNTGNAIFIRLGHRNKGHEPGELRHIFIANVKVEITGRKPDKSYEYVDPHLNVIPGVFPSVITGIPGHPVKDVSLENIDITFKGGATKETTYITADSLQNIPENESGYPECSMFGELPAWGFYVRHVDGLKLKNISLRYQKDDFRPAVIMDDVKNLLVDGMEIPATKVMPVIIMNNVTDKTLENIQLPVSNSMGIRSN